MLSVVETSMHGQSVTGSDAVVIKKNVLCNKYEDDEKKTQEERAEIIKGMLTPDADDKVVAFNLSNSKVSLSNAMTEVLDPEKHWNKDLVNAQRECIEAAVALAKATVLYAECKKEEDKHMMKVTLLISDVQNQFVKSLHSPY